MYAYVYKRGVVPCSKEEFVLNHSPLKKSFVLTGLLTIAAVVLRTVLQFTAIDHSTGFYHSGVVEIIFNVFLLAAVALIWLSVRSAVSVKTTLPFTICAKSVALAKAMAASSSITLS